MRHSKHLNRTAWSIALVDRIIAHLPCREGRRVAANLETVRLHSDKCQPSPRQDVVFKVPFQDGSLGPAVRLQITASLPHAKTSY